MNPFDLWLRFWLGWFDVATAELRHCSEDLTRMMVTR